MHCTKLLFLTPLLLLLTTNAAHAQERIRVESATYGGNVDVNLAGGNATNDIARYCDHRSVCDYPIDVERLGDPFPNVPKDFAVRYNCDGRESRVERAAPEANHQVLRLTCP